jgi:prefoldin alpha subunit
MASQQGGMSVQDAVQQLDVYRRQIELAGRNVEFLEGMLSDAEQARDALEQWKDAEKDAEVLVPLGGNTYVLAKVADASRAIVGLGAGYSAERPTIEAVKILEKRTEEIRDQVSKVTQAVYELQQQAAQLQDAVESAIQQGDQGGQ